MNQTARKNAFTLIELLMVIAIIGILAGILIPTVGAVRKKANIAASKSQLSNYVTAITMFKGEYGYLPFISAAGDQTIDLSGGTQSEDFIKTLSGRNPSNGNPVAEGGNRRQIAFHSFSESEFFYNVSTDSISPTQLADRFNNTKIFLRLDGDGNGQVDPSPTTNPPAAPANPLRTTVTAWVEADTAEGYPGYSLWD
jgi:prepilin-type N-terminal cleavage/methylation domain-containing protein